VADGSRSVDSNFKPNAADRKLVNIASTAREAGLSSAESFRGKFESATFTGRITSQLKILSLRLILYAVDCRDRTLFLNTEAGDAEAHGLTGLEILGRLLSETHAWGSAGGDDITRP
jgi:hypothetical protein